MKSLAKDTAIYGLSSIIGKFLNYLLVPLYTYVLARTDDYGIVTNLYAWTALLLVILTYGMETGFFRFANREDYDAKSVYKTAFFTLLGTSSAFALMILLFQLRLRRKQKFNLLLQLQMKSIHPLKRQLPQSLLQQRQ